MLGLFGVPLSTRRAEKKDTAENQSHIVKKNVLTRFGRLIRKRYLEQELHTARRLYADVNGELDYEQQRSRQLLDEPAACARWVNVEV